MIRASLCLKIQGSELWAVPAVHFRLAFAEQVHALCADPRTRPEAIAVELGPQAAAAAWAFLRELEVGPGSRSLLPCMLGLIRPNRRIRPSARELAVRLQEATGQDLSELPPSLLKELLGYSAVSVLYLSPVDSIIEAVRCALELQIPVYGVDLDETAEPLRKRTMIQDPSLAAGQTETYVRRNEVYAQTHRDEEIDSRREFAMAARLRTALGRHKRVLFTGGLAHWVPLKRLLAEAGPRPAPVSPAAETRPEGFQRVVVHPLLAVYHMDTFPAFAHFYEARRIPADQGLGVAVRDVVDAPEKFTQMLQEAYRRHLGSREKREQMDRLLEDPAAPQPRNDGMEEKREQMDRLLEDWDARADFEQLLTNLALVRQMAIPDLFTTLAAAEGTMSPRFCRILAEVFMEFPWAAPKGFEHLPILAPSPTATGSHIRAELVGPDGSHGRHFYIDPLPGGGGGSYRVRIPIPWTWQQQPPPPAPEEPVERRSWEPRDNLTTALSLRAAELAKSQADRKLVEPFMGSLCEGVDVKTTLRAYSRGDDRVYVRDTRRPKRKSVHGDDDPFPIVWILRPGGHPEATWFFFADTLKGEIVEGFSDPRRVQRLQKQKGLQITEGFALVHKHPPPGMPPSRTDIEQLDLLGLLLYMPGHFSKRQYGAWMDRKTRWEGNEIKTPCPVLSPLSDTKSYLRARHGIDLGKKDWPTAMVRAAIAYADTAVTVVAPDGFGFGSVVHEQAARNRVQVRVVPLSYLPREEVRKMSTYYFVPKVRRGDHTEYPEYVERTLGEPESAYRNLVPPKWLQYGLEPRR